MGLILNIETATKTCSVALAKNGELLHFEEMHDVYSHAGKLNVFIERVLNKSNRSFQDLDAIALSIGPGSYTGLRIGLSAAKGFCYALDLPLITVSTLKSLAYAMVSQNRNEAGLYMPSMDARRNEVYTAVYNEKLEEVVAPHAKVLDEQSFAQFKNNAPIFIAGSGAEKSLNIIPNISWQEILNIPCSAKNIIALSQQLFEHKSFSNVAYTEPSYLKPYHSTRKG